jgi:excisionase family DNA binding protein
MVVVATGTRLGLAEAAGELGVHYQTAYRWVRQGRLPAAKVGGSYEIDRCAVSNLRRDRSTPAPPPRRRVRRWAPLAERLHAALVAGDESRVGQLLDPLVAGGVAVVDLCERALVPALVRIGEQWASGELGIAEEHRASAICERAVGRWSEILPGRPRGVAVVCSPPSEGHQLPGHMATAALRRDRWRVHHLGVGVPVAAVARLAEWEAADVVVISVTLTHAGGEAAAMAATLGAGGRRVLVGGPGRRLAELLRGLELRPAPA